MMKKSLLTMLVMSGMAVAAQAAPGAYMNGNIGIGGMDTEKTSSDTYGYQLRSGVSYRAALGYLMGEGQLNYGAELGYTGYPKNKYNSWLADVTYSGYYADVLGVGKYNLSTTDSGFFVLGKAGLAYVSQKTRTTGIYSNTTKHAVKPELALGAGYNFNKKVAVDLTFAHVFGGQANPASTSTSAATRVSAVNTLMAGITYSFS